MIKMIILYHKHNNFGLQIKIYTSKNVCKKRKNTCILSIFYLFNKFYPRMYANLYVSDTSSEEDEPPPARVYRNRLTLADYTDDQVVSHFRLSRDAINALADRIYEPLRSSYEGKNVDINPLQKLQIALFYYATGERFIMPPTIARACGVSQQLVSNAITQVTNALFDVANEFVKFPQPNSLDEIKAGFYSVIFYYLFNFYPNVL